MKPRMSFFYKDNNGIRSANISIICDTEKECNDNVEKLKEYIEKNSKMIKWGKEQLTEKIQDNRDIIRYKKNISIENEKRYDRGFFKTLFLEWKKENN